MQLTANSTVREVLLNYPHTFDVFLSHGMCESCQTDPPPVPLEIFARKHCNGDLGGLIRELNTQMAG